MIDKSFHNDSTQKERRAVLDNDRQVKRENDTFFSRATASVGEELGPQHKKMANQSIVGSFGYQVPRTPSVWANVDREPERPIPYNDMLPFTGYDQRTVDGSPLPEQNSHSSPPVQCDAASGRDRQHRWGGGRIGHDVSRHSLNRRHRGDTGRHDHAQVVPSFFPSTKPMRRL